MFEKKCSCAQGYHRAPLESVDIGSGVIDKLPQILKSYASCYLVADERTYEVAGKKAEALLAAAGKRLHTYVMQGETILPDAYSIGSILLNMRPLDEEADINEPQPLPDIIVGVGSGVINDCCRVVSRRIGRPYAIVGTAPSMDGYASAGSPTLHDGTKSTVKCTTPRHIICDTAIAAEAPYPMILAGIGDMMAKYTGILDWEIARDINGDYFCAECAEEVLRVTDRCTELADKLSVRDTGAMESLFEGFVATGIGMAYTGCSRPASGSEHMVAHAFELAAIERGDAPALHGIEVAEATRLIISMYCRLYRETDDRYVKGKIEEYLDRFKEADRICRVIDLPVTEKDAIMEGIERGYRLRDRYTILRYLHDRGLLQDYAASAADEILSGRVRI